MELRGGRREGIEKSNGRNLFHAINTSFFSYPHRSGILREKKREKPRSDLESHAVYCKLCGLLYVGFLSLLLLLTVLRVVLPRGPTTLFLAFCLFIFCFHLMLAYKQFQMDIIIVFFSFSLKLMGVALFFLSFSEACFLATLPRPTLKR